MFPQSNMSANKLTAFKLSMPIGATRAALVVFICASSISLAVADAPPVFSDESIQRADELLNQMTLEEKVGQLNQLFKFPESMLASLPKSAAAYFPDLEGMARNGQLGSVVPLADGDAVDRLQHIAVENSRLHIPLLFGRDVIHGFDTIFPVPIAMAASWDPALVEKTQAIAALEASVGGTHWTFAAMVDINRDPRWGRMVEGAGEDPYLGAAMARAQVRGFQGPAIGTPDHLMACLKHFAGYGASEGGRDHDGVNLSQAQLQNVILPPFKAGVQAGVGTVMTAYMDLNDVPATGNRWLLHDLLRDDWGFKGFVVSDAGAVNDLVPHGFAKDDTDAAGRGLYAGVNLAMGTSNTAFTHLADAVKSGAVTMRQIDDAVRPLLAAKYQLGLFEHPYINAKRSKQVAAQKTAHLQVARIAAERSAVLLRNEGGLLPLSKSKYKKIAVIGPVADSKAGMRGPWLFAKDNGEAVTIAEGIRAKLGSKVNVTAAPGVQILRQYPSPFEIVFREKTPAAWDQTRARDEFDTAVKLAGESDLVVMAVGETQTMTGESSSASTLDLAGDQQKLMEAIAATGKPLVLVLINGRPLNVSWANAHIPAILDAWYPGTEGGSAIANLLFGDAVPGGKLPFTWPRHEGQIPIYYAHNLTQDPQGQATRYWNEASTPLFSFGYGLSYSTFSFSDIKFSADQIKNDGVNNGGTIEVSAQLKNTGSVTADEVAQLYIHQRYGSASRPVRELKGFQRVTLMPGESRAVRFSLGKDELAYWSSAANGWVNEESQFDVWIGGDSQAPLHGTFSVKP